MKLTPEARNALRTGQSTFTLSPAAARPPAAAEEPPSLVLAYLSHCGRRRG